MLTLYITTFWIAVYVDIGRESGETAIIDIELSSPASEEATNTEGRNWDIKVAQIPCGSETA